MTTIPTEISAALADRYAIEREIGQGGMATVYLAEDLKHQRKVAIKVLRPELAAILGADRFVQENRTTAHLQHPNILPLFDSGEAGGFLYYVMPYVQGETLRETLTRNQLLADALQSRVNALTTDFVNRDDPLQRAAIAADRERTLAELERLRKQLVDDEQAIDDLQREARRANVPAGWLR